MPSFVMELAKGDGCFAVFGIENLTHGVVNSRQAAEDTFKAGDDRNGVDTGEVTQRQQDEQHGQAAKYHLGSAVVFQCANKHKGGEDAPQQQVVAHGDLVSICDTGSLEGVCPNQHQGPPEQTVSGESGTGKVFGKFRDTKTVLAIKVNSVAVCFGIYRMQMIGACQFEILLIVFMLGLFLQSDT